MVLPSADSRATPWYPGGMPDGPLIEVTSSRLNMPAMAGGRLLPSGVVMTLTFSPVAKNEYCPPGIDGISRSPTIRRCASYVRPQEVVRSEKSTVSSFSRCFSLTILTDYTRNYSKNHRHI